MIDEATLALTFLALVLSLLITYLAYSIYGIYKNTVKGWLPITAALFVLLMARFFFLLSVLDPQAEQYALLSFITQLLTVIVYLMLFYGLWQMKSALEENERVERETMARVHEFEIKHRRHEDLRMRSIRGDRERSHLEMRRKIALTKKQGKK